jgi:hypothetical protein
MIYDLLVSAEKEFGLLKLNSVFDSTFLKQDKVQEVWENPFFALKSHQKLETTLSSESSEQDH